ncbi:Nucleic acid-binding, OB-fold [Syntrophomonas zehnderi OL-4]|uniref:Nucleic acid-binding, OB-fold n=1 Tax=Syntrophomonas zehnderi OL-4 TaxID=690567 RepID=A0A0E3W2R9_9FIRM|nr:hypothetical protein [Syntrophomonas zehnderi]CFX16081.1 Nucleic acid-binding, OB-fold [Syntrophomonas zehnderi OL-4]
MADLKPEGYRHVADTWEVLFQMKERERPVEAQVGAIDYVDGKPVWILVFPDYPGIKGYVPDQETGVDASLISRFVGQDIIVKIKGIDRENNIIACSRKEIVKEAAEDLQKKLTAGDIIPVTVRAIVIIDNISTLIVDVGGGVLVDVPRSQAVIRRAATLREQYHIGETVNAMVVSVNPLQVSVRAARPDPWSQADYKRGQFISGTVYRVVDGNVLIEPDLTPGVLGLAPIPLMGDVQKGYRVSCKVRYFSAEQKKLHLYLVNRLL